MARRILDTAFWDDTDVAELDYPERLLLICMITDESLSNDYGWLPAHPKVLKKHAFGYDNCSVSEVEGWRDAIFEKCKNVKLYSVNGQQYIDLIKFPEWQKIRYKRKTHIPPPPWWDGEGWNTTIAKWRRAVFERDGYICQHCGKTDGKMNAHHIKPWFLHPRLRYELSNGITLCPSCHKDQHTKGWKAVARRASR